MKKTAMMKKGAAFTLAAMMACTVYAPTAVFAADGTEGQPNEAPAVTEEVKEAPVEKQEAPTVEKQETPAVEKQETPAVEKQEAPAVEKQEAPAAEKQEAPAAEKQETPAVENQEAPAVENQETPAVSDQEEAVEEQAPAAEESVYGEATGSWGYGNSTQTTRWDEYTKDGETILVFRSTGESDSDEDNAVTQLLDENGNSVKEALKQRVTQVIFETGITGIGWTALYDKSAYEPVYSSDYTVDRSRTDLFKDFTKLTVVVPCETIKRIGWSAFRKCNNLREFDFTKCTQLEEIMNQAFNECKALNNVDLSNCNNLKSINWAAFKGAGQGSETILALPTDGVLSVIGGYAFYNYASKQKKNTEVDFSVVAGSVTQVLQNAFAGSRIAGKIAGFKSLETLGNNALGKYISYEEYVPPQEEEEEPPVQEEIASPVQEEEVVPQVQEEEKASPVQEEEVVPQVQEEEKVSPVQEEEEEPQVQEEELPAVQDEGEPAPQNDVMPVMLNVVAPVILKVAAEVVPNETAAETNIETASALAANVNATAAAAAEAAPETAAAPAVNAAAESANANVETAKANAETAKATAEAAASKGATGRTASISDNETAMAAPAVVDAQKDIPAGSSLGSILGGIAAAILMALAVIRMSVRRKSDAE